MWVINDTTERIALAKGHLTDSVGVGAIVVESTYSVLPEGLARASEPVRGPSHPPDTSRVVLWREVSVTASGAAYGPPRPPYVCPVSLSVGHEMRRMIVFGPRRFKRTLVGELEPSPAEPFDAVPIGWDQAFGGGYFLPPGLMPGSGLPHPGMRVLHPVNRFGVGFYPDKHAATDQPLPAIERPDQLIRRWNDQPTPAGLSPCPDLNMLRLPQRFGGHSNELRGASVASDPAEAMAEDAPLVVLRLQHHAPGDLIFPSVPPGTAVALVGLGRTPLRFDVPASPISVRTRRRKQMEQARPALRSLHIDADTGTLDVVYGHAFRYDLEDPPSWVLVNVVT